MVHRIIPFARQHETHRQLVGLARPGLGRRKPHLDAIIVPAARPAGNLDHAVTLARAVGCTLVVLCSKEAQAAEVSELLAARGFGQAVVADIPDDYDHHVLDFASSRLMRSELPPFFENPNGDLSVKRNLGLLLARMLGWERVFFMDDDIRDVASADIFAAIAMLGRYRSVGMRVTDFPDNSVVCHAHRETGAAQDIFISGSVLATNCFEATSFFPEIYNEDWLFFYDDAHLRRLRVVRPERNATAIRPVQPAAAGGTAGVRGRAGGRALRAAAPGRRCGRRHRGVLERLPDGTTKIPREHLVPGQSCGSGNPGEDHRCS